MTELPINNTSQQYTLHEGNIIIHCSNIVEVIINEGIEVSLEILDKVEQLLLSKLNNKFALLINKTNRCSFSFEAQLCVLSLPRLVATAKVYYHDDEQDFLPTIMQRQKTEQLNLKSFAAVNNGYNEAKFWLTTQLDL